MVSGNIRDTRLDMNLTELRKAYCVDRSVLNQSPRMLQSLMEQGLMKIDPKLFRMNFNSVIPQSFFYGPNLIQNYRIHAAAGTHH